jgi:catechol 2,3-dioxygenase-like lactoylglutathione lyase family enzyme
MIDHVTVRVRDLARSKAFYSAALAPLGYRLGHEATYDGVAMIGFVGPEKRFDTWFVADAAHPSGPTHLCWRAADRASVAAFHAAALAAGGKDNGAPGLRPHYHEHYYGAFVFDPDGNNVEAVCHEGP